MSKKIKLTNKLPTKDGLYLYQDNDVLKLMVVFKDCKDKKLFWKADYPNNNVCSRVEKNPNCKWFGPIVTE